VGGKLNGAVIDILVQPKRAESEGSAFLESLCIAQDANRGS
jgi:hypothetical protein